jgi:hypothetical protein
VHFGETLVWVHKLQLGLVEFELDSKRKRVVDSFLFLTQDYYEFGVNINHCKFIFSNYYRNSSVKFVQRQQIRLSIIYLRRPH